MHVKGDVGVMAPHAFVEKPSKSVKVPEVYSDIFGRDSVVVSVGLKNGK